MSKTDGSFGQGQAAERRRSILLVEDNQDILRINRTFFTGCGYRILEAENLEQAQARIAEQPDLIVLDVMLPDGSGLEFCRQVRQVHMVPILFLTAMSSNRDVIQGLNQGGDDYLTKPYDLEVLLARVEALLRRAEKAEATHLSFGPLEIDFLVRRVLKHGEDLLLTPKEFALFACLMRWKERFVTAEELYEMIWGQVPFDSRQSVKEHVSRLRRKLGEDVPITIESLRRKGYRLTVGRD